MDLGSLPRIPPWVFVLFIVMAAIGLSAIIGGVAYLIVCHLRWI
jgi:hypothetical protein